MNNEVYQKIFSELPQPYLILKPDLEIVNANSAYLDMVSMSVHKITGKHLFDVFPPPPDDPTKIGQRFVQASLDKVIRTKKPDKFENLKYDIPSAEQGFENRYWSVLTTPHLNEKNEVTLLILEVQDVTAYVKEKNRSEIIEESEIKFRQIANAMPQIVWTARPDGYVDWYNDWWYKYTGALPGSKWDDAVSPMHPDDVRPTLKCWAKSIATGEPYQMEFRFKRKSDGRYRWHLGRAMPVKDQNGKILRWIGSNTDVHDHKMMVQKLEEEKRLREGFVSALTHDLKTPLTAAKVSAHLIARRLNEPDEVMKFVPKVISNIDRIETMIRDLLDANRLKAGEGILLDFDSCDLVPVAKDTLHDLSTVHGDRFVLTGDRTALGYWSCNGFRRIIENLCSNAIKYGSLTDTITVHISKKAENLSLKVHNSGNAIAAEDQKFLFDPYRRTIQAETSQQKGWGIGLALVKGITEAHGGKVQVESSVEHGTTFTITVPVREATDGEEIPKYRESDDQNNLSI